MKFLNGKNFPVFPALIVLALVGAACLLFVTRDGICTLSDSAYYVGAARTLLNNHAFGVPLPGGGYKPLTVWPPMYPALLAAIGAFGPDPLEAARWLHALLFGMNIFMVGLLTKRTVKGTGLFPLAASVLVLSSVHLLGIHWLALSEPLFIFLLLLSLYLLTRYVESSEVRWLICAAGAVAGAWLTRYAGASLVATGIIAIVYLGRSAIRKRLFHAALFTVLSSLPAALWMARNHLVAGSATSKHLAWHPVSLSLLEEYLYQLMLMSWPVGMIVSAVAAIALAGFCLTLALGAKREKARLGLPVLQRVPLLFIICYLGLVLVSISLLDANLAQDTWRLLLPVYVVGLVFVLGLAQQLLRSMEKQETLRRLAFVCAVAYVCAFAYPGINWTLNARSNEPEDFVNTNYTSKFWTRSKVIQEIQSLPADTPVYTNGPDALYLLTGRPTYSLPFKFFAETQKANPKYEEEMQKMSAQLRDGGVIVLLRTHEFSNLPTKKELKEALSLGLVSKGPVGAIYKISDSANDSEEDETLKEKLTRLDQLP